MSAGSWSICGSLLDFLLWVDSVGEPSRAFFTDGERDLDLDALRFLCEQIKQESTSSHITAVFPEKHYHELYLSQAQEMVCADQVIKVGFLWVCLLFFTGHISICANKREFKNYYLLSNHYTCKS